MEAIAGTRDPSTGLIDASDGAAQHVVPGIVMSDLLGRSALRWHFGVDGRLVVRDPAAVAADPCGSTGPLLGTGSPVGPSDPFGARFGWTLLELLVRTRSRYMAQSLAAWHVLLTASGRQACAVQTGGPVGAARTLRLPVLLSQLLLDLDVGRLLWAAVGRGVGYGMVSSGSVSVPSVVAALSLAEVLAEAPQTYPLQERRVVWRCVGSGALARSAAAAAKPPPPAAPLDPRTLLLHGPELGAALDSLAETPDAILGPWVLDRPASSGAWLGHSDHALLSLYGLAGLYRDVLWGGLGLGWLGGVLEQYPGAPCAQPHGGQWVANVSASVSPRGPGHSSLASVDVIGLWSGRSEAAGVLGRLVPLALSFARASPLTLAVLGLVERFARHSAAAGRVLLVESDRGSVVSHVVRWLQSHPIPCSAGCRGCMCGCENDCLGAIRGVRALTNLAQHGLGLAALEPAAAWALQAGRGPIHAALQAVRGQASPARPDPRSSPSSMGGCRCCLVYALRWLHLVLVLELRRGPSATRERAEGLSLAGQARVLLALGRAPMAYRPLPPGTCAAEADSSGLGWLLAAKSLVIVSAGLRACGRAGSLSLDAVPLKECAAVAQQILTRDAQLAQAIAAPSRQPAYWLWIAAAAGLMATLMTRLGRTADTHATALRWLRQGSLCGHHHQHLIVETVLLEPEAIPDSATLGGLNLSVARWWLGDRADSGGQSGAGLGYWCHMGACGLVSAGLALAEAVGAAARVLPPPPPPPPPLRPLLHPHLSLDRLWEGDAADPPKWARRAWWDALKQCLPFRGDRCHPERVYWASRPASWVVAAVRRVYAGRTSQSSSDRSDLTVALLQRLGPPDAQLAQTLLRALVDPQSTAPSLPALLADTLGAQDPPESGWMCVSLDRPSAPETLRIRTAASAVALAAASLHHGLLRAPRLSDGATRHGTAVSWHAAQYRLRDAPGMPRPLAIRAVWAPASLVFGAAQARAFHSARSSLLPLPAPPWWPLAYLAGVLAPPPAPPQSSLSDGQAAACVWMARELVRPDPVVLLAAILTLGAVAAQLERPQTHAPSSSSLPTAATAQAPHSASHRAAALASQLVRLIRQLVAEPPRPSLSADSPHTHLALMAALAGWLDVITPGFVGQSPLQTCFWWCLLGWIVAYLARCCASTPRSLPFPVLVMWSWAVGKPVPQHSPVSDGPAR